MRKYCLIFILGFVFQNLYAQENTTSENKIFSIGVNSGFKSFIGNNFIAKTYKPSAFISFDIRGSVYKNWGAGFGYETSAASLKTTEYVGNSTKGKIHSWSGYIFYNARINDKWLFVPKLGIATFTLTNTLHAQDYYENYNYHTKGNAYFIAPEINYFITPKFSVNANVQYNYINLHNMHANESIIGTSYQSTNQLTASLGIRFWF